MNFYLKYNITHIEVIKTKNEFMKVLKIYLYTYIVLAISCVLLSYFIPKNIDAWIPNLFYKSEFYQDNLPIYAPFEREWTEYLAFFLFLSFVWLPKILLLRTKSYLIWNLKMKLHFLGMFVVTLLVVFLNGEFLSESIFKVLVSKQGSLVIYHHIYFFRNRVHRQSEQSEN